MIALYPLLVSNTISKNIVPGICKVLENYIIVYGLDGLLARVRKSSNINGDYTIKLNKVIRKEDMEHDLTNFLYREFIEEQSGIYGQTGPGSKQTSDRDRRKEARDEEKLDLDRKKDARDRIKNIRDREKFRRDIEKSGGEAEKRGLEIERLKAKDASVKLDVFNMQSISLEPTWMKIDQYDRFGNKSSGLIGVKVVPYAVKSDAKLAQLLMFDNQVTKMQKMAILTGRKITSFFYRTWMKVWTKVPLIGGSPSVVSGDPRKDILLKRNMISAGHAQDIFVLANQAELNDEFYTTAKGMMNLQKMGWGSIMIADDVNRRVAFCMKELRGLCSVMPYTMLYQTFSQAKVYEDIEDAKRNAASIFKVARKPLSKLIGESMAQSKIEGFSNQHLPLVESEYIEELSYIDENIGAFIKSMNPTKLKMAIKNFTSGNVDKIPNTTNEKLVQYGMKINPEFRKGYNLSKKVIMNSSPELSEKVAEVGATLCCVQASFKAGDYMTNVKASLKQLIALFRKFKRKANPDKAKMPAEHYMDAVFGWVVILFSLASLVFSFPIFQAVGNALYKFAKVSSEFFEGFNPQTVMKTVEDTISGLQPQEYVATHAPAILLAFLGMAFLWRFIKGENK